MTFKKSRSLIERDFGLVWLRGLSAWCGLGSIQTDQTDQVKQTHDLKGRVQLPPASSEVGRVAPRMMIVLEQLTDDDDVPGQGVAGVIVRLLEIPVAVHVTAPIHNRAMQRSHDEAGDQEEQLPG